MCGILAAYIVPGEQEIFDLRPAMQEQAKRGRDSWGYTTVHGIGGKMRFTSPGKCWFPIGNANDAHECILNGKNNVVGIIANFRAEPTPEFVVNKTEADIQPFYSGSVYVSHNGNISNVSDFENFFKDNPDKAPRTTIDSAILPGILSNSHPMDWGMRLFEQIKGSWALAAMKDGHPGIFISTNYKPLYHGTSALGSNFFASNRSVLEKIRGVSNIQPVPQYSYAWVKYLPPVYVSCSKFNRRTLVVCSSGLDSTTALASIIDMGYDAEILHFDYGCHAELQETNAIKKIADFYNVPLHVLDVTDIFSAIGGSTLTNKKCNGVGSSISGGRTGAKTPTEWVPARNLILLSIATGFAESHGISNIALGNNLEESGTHPDNEPEFIDRINQVMPYAVGENQFVRFIQPVGNLMKREIIELGTQLGVPWELTYSCYRGGEKHCGNCGPCFIRKRAFIMAGLNDPTTYCS